MFKEKIEYEYKNAWLKGLMVSLCYISLWCLVKLMDFGEITYTKGELVLQVITFVYIYQYNKTRAYAERIDELFNDVVKECDKLMALYKSSERKAEYYKKQFEKLAPLKSPEKPHN